MRFFRLFLFLSVFFNSAYADNISLNLNIESNPKEVSVNLKNTGSDPAKDLAFEVLLNGKSYKQRFDKALKSQESLSHKFTLDSGLESDALITKIFYRNQGREVSLVNASTFIVDGGVSVSNNCSLPDASIYKSDRLSWPGEGYEAVLPEEIAHSIHKNGSAITLQNKTSLLNLNYDYFALKKEFDGQKLLSIDVCQARISTKANSKASSLFHDYFLYLALIASLIYLLLSLIHI